MYADRIKGNSPEHVFELSKSEAMPIILKSIRYLSELSMDTAQDEAQDLLEQTKEQHRKEILDAYEKTNRSHEEILRFMLGAEEHNN